MFYTTQEIADILKISKSIVIGENEKCVFYFTEKTKWIFWPTRYIGLHHQVGEEQEKHNDESVEETCNADMSNERKPGTLSLGFDVFSNV